MNGKDDEELFEFAMHDKQYRDFKSGAAKQRFNAELDAAIKEKYKNQDIEIPNVRLLRYPDAEPIVSPYTGNLIWELDFIENSKEPVHGRYYNEGDTLCYIQTKFGIVEIKSFCNGRIVGVEKKQGEKVYKNDTLGYIQQK